MLHRRSHLVSHLIVDNVFIVTASVGCTHASLTKIIHAYLICANSVLNSCVEFMLMVYGQSGCCKDRVRTVVYFVISSRTQ